jgi:hypothetical protein
MGQRITFRGSGNAVAKSLSSGVVSGLPVEPRLGFKKGWLTGGSDPEDGSLECGYGTSCPIPVTLSQLYEIIYRVKDSAITSGKVLYTDEFSSNEIIFILGGGVPDKNQTRVFNEPFIFYSCGHGYVVNTTIYEESPENLFGEPYLTEDGTGPFYDALSDERVIWYMTNSFSTGITHSIIYDNFFFSSSDYPTRYGVYTYTPPNPEAPEPTPDYGSGSLDYILGRVVAWVGGDSPFSPESSLWLSASLNVSSLGLFFGLGISSEKSEYTSRIEGVFEIELSNNDVISIPGFVNESIIGATEVITPFRVKATEWWPYATTAGDPAWNAETGLPVNGGPAA